MNISNLKNIEKNKDIYIVANGHSANDQETLIKLSNKTVIGMNATPLLEKRSPLKIKYYTVSDSRFLMDPEKFEIATGALSKDTIRVFRKELKSIDSSKLINQSYYINSIGRDGFSHNLKLGFYFGCTTTMLSIQLASYLGAKNIYLVGVDLTYPKDNPRFYEEKKPSPIDNFTCVQIKNIRNAYVTLREKGVNLFNCSSTSLLKPYVPFKEIT